MNKEPRPPADQQPPAEAAEVSHGKPKASHAKITKNLTAVSPFAVSVIAVVISLLAYLDQHSTNEGARISSQQTYAANSSFWLVAKPSTSQNSARQAIEQGIQAGLRALEEAGIKRTTIWFSESMANELPVTVGNLLASTELIEIPTINVDTSVEQ